MQFPRLKLKTLRARIALYVALLVAGSLITGIGAAVGIMNLHQDMGFAARGYRQLRDVYEVGFHVATARDVLSGAPANHDKAAAAVEIALVKFQASRELTSESGTLAQLRNSADALRRTDSGAALVAINGALVELADDSAKIRQNIDAQELTARRDRRAALIHVSLFSAAVVLAGAIVGARLYRCVIRPIENLRAGVRRFATGRLEEQLKQDGDRELSALAGDFNFMAQELGALYEQLEQRVQIKSRQLVQSERLAGVGFLAAGLAHEINNPLGIIAGYGERAMQRLSRAASEPATQQVRDDLAVICDEAFRCKEITDRLLMLSRGGDQARRIISFEAIAREVIASVGALTHLGERRITLQTQADQDLNVLANESELRQLMLNLLINALEAVAPESGHVNVSVARIGDEVELSVRDNGKGMSPQTLARIFEPFFTDKRGLRPGTGLGLSVAHSIVQDHHGRIEAYSDGPGTGSRFVVRFPVATKEACDVGNG